jgi:hypothetical protein
MWYVPMHVHSRSAEHWTACKCLQSSRARTHARPSLGLQSFLNLGGLTIAFFGWASLNKNWRKKSQFSRLKLRPFVQKNDHTTGFEENRRHFCKKMAKFAENSGHYIVPEKLHITYITCMGTYVHNRHSHFCILFSESLGNAAWVFLHIPVKKD